MSKTVLVVDDSMMVRQQVTRALAAGGFVVVEAKDGVDGLEKLKAAKDVLLVICDVNMPRMDGLQFVEEVRGDPAYAHLAIVMLTTEGQPELVQRAKALGAKGWIVKPFKPDQLLAVAHKLTAQAA
jgi:two-component system chemotaxis response regulator CheY